LDGRSEKRAAHVGGDISGANMRIMSEDEIRRLLRVEDVISTVEEAFRTRYPNAVMPPRTHIDVAGGSFLVMSCYDTIRDELGLKLVAVQQKPEWPAHRVQATYMILDTAVGVPKAIISANYLTDLRTAAVSAVATKYLARQNLDTLGILGTGRQAEVHLKVLAHVRKFSRILVCGSNATCSRDFAQRMSVELNVAVEPADARTCAMQSDVLCTCTTAIRPLFDGRLIRPGTHLNLVGAFQQHTREVDSATIRRSRVFVDTYDGALSEAGDLLIPMSEGLISRDHLLADLHELVTGKKLGRVAEADVTLFKSLGCCLEDLVTAELLADIASSLRFSADECDSTREMG
jgi:alanine dehydrogenase